MNLKFVIFFYLILNYLTFATCILNFKLSDNIAKFLSDLLRFGTNNFSNKFSRQFSEEQIQFNREYDFIIVGAGPAGCVLANRLTENKNWNVLLIEAGEWETIMHQIPIVSGYLQGTASNWNYYSEPQKRSCFGMNDNRCALPRGKCVGGTSSINYMIYNRGNRRDFDRWAESGNPGWSYNDVLPYFLKSERSTLHGLEYSKYHNHNGPLNVEDVPYRTQTVHAFIAASREAGLAQVDYNGETQLGISYVQATTINGRRHSAARAYIDPIRNRKNLHIMTSTRVSKVLIDPEIKIAYGVEFIHNRKVNHILARKEVILSAGAFNSPQILILSGIGTKQQLNAINVPQIQELPVGQVLYDHLSHLGPTFIVNTTGNTQRVSDITLNSFKQFIHGQGQLTSIGGVEALGFIKTPNSQEPPDFPDVELIFVAGSLASDQGTGLKQGGNIRDDIYNNVYRSLENGPNDHFTTLIMQFHPKSFGYLQLRDSNPFHWPIINPNYLENDDDIETLLNGIKAAIRISKSPSMQKIGARLHDIPLPGCEHILFGSDDYWRCSIRTMSYTLHHQVATCKMGPSTDRTTVVNNELKVHGIKRLRVVDTSIIPFPPTAHTNAASFMIGEKAADMIRNEWR